MKDFLIRVRVYDTTGFLPDIFGEEQTVIRQYPSEKDAWISTQTEIQSMVSHAVIKEIKQIN